MPVKATSRKTKRIVSRGNPASKFRANQSGRVLAALGDLNDRKMGMQIQSELAKADRIVIAGHERPDGDCVGSTVALCSILRAQGYNASVVLDPIPERYQFLNTGGWVREMGDGEHIDRVDADLAILLDTTEFERVGGLDRDSFTGARVINIDHHISNRNFGDINWVDSTAAAAGELVWRLSNCFDWKVPQVALEALYVALVTDTGQFAYSNTTPRILRMAASLIEAGVDSEDTWRRIYLNKSKNELELEARARQSMEVWAGGKIASISLTHQDFVETGTGPDVTSELVGIPRSLSGSELALFFYEIEGGAVTKVSIRTTRNLDATVLARAFGGGGHRQAAGCSIAAPLPGAKRKFARAARKLVKDSAL